MGVFHGILNFKNSTKSRKASQKYLGQWQYGIVFENSSSTDVGYVLKGVSLKMFTFPWI